MSPHLLLTLLVRENPFQPATSWWRAIEIATIVSHGLPRGRGLDLGCGDGKLMRILLDAASATPSLVGVDPDPLETRDAAFSSVYERVHTARGDHIPEPDASFDFVFSNSVLEHIEDIEPILAEVRRLLHCGGVFLFTVPGAAFHECLSGPLLPWRRRDEYLGQVDRRCAHVRYWGEGDWRDCLLRHGLAPVKVLPYLSAPQVRRWESLSRFTAGIAYSLVGERMQPIDIQRRLGVRRRTVRLPMWAAHAFARVISAGAPTPRADRHGCLLIEARKTC